MRVILVTIAALLLAACSDGSSSSSTATVDSIAKQYLSASIAKDVATMKSLAVPDSVAARDTQHVINFVGGDNPESQLPCQDAGNSKAYCEFRVPSGKVILWMNTAQKPPRVDHFAFGR